MKKAVGICALLLVACAASVANAVVVIDGNLNNGNMDQIAISSQLLATPEGWVATSDNNDGLSSEPWNNVADATGDCDGGTAGCGVFFKAFHGAEATPFSASMHQDNPGTPGMKYILTGWVGAGAFYSGVDPLSVTSTQFGLEFLDSDSLVIGGQVLELDSTNGLGVPNDHPAGFGYKQYMAMAVAPPDTDTVRVRFSMIDGYAVPGGDPALVTDDYTLICIPEPASVALGLIGLLGLMGLVRRR